MLKKFCLSVPLTPRMSQRQHGPEKYTTRPFESRGVPMSAVLCALFPLLTHVATGIISLFVVSPLLLIQLWCPMYRRNTSESPTRRRMLSQPSSTSEPNFGACNLTVSLSVDWCLWAVSPPSPRSLVGDDGQVGRMHTDCNLRRIGGPDTATGRSFAVRLEQCAQFPSHLLDS